MKKEILSMNRKITIFGNSAAGAAAAAVLSKHNTVTVTMDPADCADAASMCWLPTKPNSAS